MEAEPRRNYDRICSPEFVEGLESMPIEELRSRRALCEKHEAELSYARRLLQGKLDILRHELERRASGRNGGIRGIIDNLSEILANHESSELALKRHAPVLLPAALERQRREVDKVASDTVLAEIESLSVEEISALVERLKVAEARVSEERQCLFDVMNRLGAEVVRRYRDGEQDPAALLKA